MKTIPALLIALNFLIALPALAEQSAQVSSAGQSQEEVIDNVAVIKLNQLSLGESVIIEKIRISRCNFDTSVNGLSQLKEAGVTNTVIAAILATKSGNGSGGPAVLQSSDLNDPSTPHEAGIWLYEENDGKPKMTQLEPSVYSQSKSGAGIFMQFGETLKQKAVMRGSHAELATTNCQPIFYFYFEHTQAGLSDNNGATSPNEYALAQFEVVEKDNQRSLVMSSINAYSGGQHGADGKAIRSFSFQKLSPGIYKVTPREALSDGEFGFFYGGTGRDTTGGKVFDFGVKNSAQTETMAADPQNNSPAKKTNVFKQIFAKKSASTNRTIVAHDTAN
jgi:hypothetical protein